ncbi:MAG: hypothetical protein ACLPYZ_06805 [Limisphaerales bacterium]
MKTKGKSIILVVCHLFAGRIRLAILFAVLWLATLAGIRVSAAGFNSGIIDFDSNFAADGYPAYGPGAAAIGSAGDLWNTVSVTYYGGTPKGPLNLYNTDGTSTSVEWSLSSGGGISDTIGGTYGSLFDTSVAFYSATITGLTPNEQYNLYLYSVCWDEVISVNGIDFTTYGIHSGSVNSLTAGSQYDVHTVTADSSGTLAFVPISAEFGTPYISSWQLTPVPEPSTISLAGLVLLASAALQLTRSQKRCS